MNESTCSHDPCKEAQMYVNGDLLSGLSIYEGDYACLIHKIKGGHAMCGYKNSEDCRIQNDSTCSAGHVRCLRNDSNVSLSSVSPIQICKRHQQTNPHATCGTPLGEKCRDIPSRCPHGILYQPEQGLFYCEDCHKQHEEEEARIEALQPEKAEVFTPHEIALDHAQYIVKSAGQGFPLKHIGDGLGTPRKCKWPEQHENLAQQYIEHEATIRAKDKALLGLKEIVERQKGAIEHRKAERDEARAENEILRQVAGVIAAKDCEGCQNEEWVCFPCIARDALTPKPEAGKEE